MSSDVGVGAKAAGSGVMTAVFAVLSVASLGTFALAVFAMGWGGIGVDTAAFLVGSAVLVIIAVLGFKLTRRGSMASLLLPLWMVVFAVLWIAFD